MTALFDFLWLTIVILESLSQEWTVFPLSYVIKAGFNNKTNKGSLLLFLL